ncbi:hypothetical protein ACHAQA_009702 [Verticillium albo-atrum]
MGVTRTSNDERALWRTKCREALASHINSQLGITVDPVDVRLLPTSEDSYEWKILPEKKHLFAKHLSKHSKGVYQELIREAGTSFEAVTRAAGTTGHTATTVTFSERIDRLTADNVRLFGELEAATSRCEMLEADLAQNHVELEVATHKMKEMTGLIFRYKDVMMKALKESYRAFEDFVPSDMLDGQANTGM